MLVKIASSQRKANKEEGEMIGVDRSQYLVYRRNLNHYLVRVSQEAESGGLWDSKLGQRNGGP